MTLVLVKWSEQPIKDTISETDTVLGLVDNDNAQISIQALIDILGGGGGGGGGTEFSDALFRINNAIDNSKEIDFDASQITPATKRTITMPDRDVDLGNITVGVIKPIRVETSDYPIVETDYTILLDASGDDVSGVLPQFPNQGQKFNIFCIDSTFICKVEGNGHSINGTMADITLIAEESIILQFDSTYGWAILARAS